MELTMAQKLIVIKTIKSWPRKLEARDLLTLLDKFAKEILEANSNG